MRRVIVQEFVSVDGFASAPDGSVDFVPRSGSGDKSLGDRQLAFVDTIDTMLLGRRTYEMFAGYWPSVTEGEDKELAKKLNHLQKVVFSRTLDEAPWGAFEAARVIRSNAANEVQALKDAAGKDLVVWGSLSVAQTLGHAGLVDEYQLIVCPVVLDGGKRIFNKVLDFELVDTRSFDRGMVLLSYRPRQRAETSSHSPG